MFTIDPNITEKELKEKDIFKVLLSMNIHQVATPETSLEEARSYVFFFREGNRKFSTYIGLHLLPTDRKLIYGHSANPFPADELPEVEGEARDFAEYMGAMMDDVDIENMSDLELDRWIEDQAFFSSKTQTEAAPAQKLPEVPEPTAAALAPVAPQAAVKQEPPEPAAEAAPAPQPQIWPEHPAPGLTAAPTPRPSVEAAQPKPAVEAAPALRPPVLPKQPAPVSILPPTPKQPEPAAGAKPASGTASAPAKRVPKISPVETHEHPIEVSATETVRQDAPPPPPSVTTKRRQENGQKEATTGIEAPPKLKDKKTSYSPTSVVSRDREALARLLTSF